MGRVGRPAEGCQDAQPLWRVSISLERVGFSCGVESLVSGRLVGFFLLAGLRLLAFSEASSS